MLALFIIFLFNFSLPPPPFFFSLLLAILHHHNHHYHHHTIIIIFFFFFFFFFLIFLLLLLLLCRLFLLLFVCCSDLGVQCAMLSVLDFCHDAHAAIIKVSSTRLFWRPNLLWLRNRPSKAVDTRRETAERRSKQLLNKKS